MTTQSRIYEELDVASTIILQLETLNLTMRRALDNKGVKYIKLHIIYMFENRLLYSL